MIIVDCEQGSEEWFNLKRGVPSASNFDKIVTSTGEPSKQAQKYMYQLAGERLSGISANSFKSDAMQRGTEMEQEAADYYALTEGAELETVGVCYFDEKKRFLASPDRLMEEKGLEIKCPLAPTHIEYVLKGKLPTTYIQQVQGQLFVTGFKEWDFMSYFPGMTPLIVKVERDEIFINKLSDALERFCDDLDKLCDKMRG